MHKYIPHKYTLLLLFPHIPWSWSCLHLAVRTWAGCLTFLSPTLNKLYVFGSGVVLRDAWTSWRSWRRHVRRCSVHETERPGGSGCSLWPSTSALGRSLFLRGAFTACCLWNGPDAPTTHTASASCLCGFPTMQETETGLMTVEFPGKNPLTHIVPWVVCLHWGFSAEESRECLAQSSIEPGQTKLTKQSIETYIRHSDL